MRRVNELYLFCVYSFLRFSNDVQCISQTYFLILFLKGTYDARINFCTSQRTKLRPPKSIYYDSQSIMLKVMNT